MMKKITAITLVMLALTLLCSCKEDGAQTTDMQTSVETEAASDTSVDTNDKDYGWSKDYI
jgi:hypothetical protein